MHTKFLYIYIYLYIYYLYIRKQCALPVIYILYISYISIYFGYIYLNFPGVKVFSLLSNLACELLHHSASLFFNQAAK